MEGSIFIVSEKGWACSNMTRLDVERDITRDEKGSKVSRQTNTLKINAIFTGKSGIKTDDLVDCVFKIDEIDRLVGYKCRVAIRSGDLTVLNILSKIESDAEIKSILDKIKT